MNPFSSKGTNGQPDFDDEEHFDPIEDLLGRLRRQRSKRPRPLARVLEASAVNQPARASAYIEKRRQGLWGKNRNDQAAFDTAKWNEDLARIIADVPTNTGRIGVHSFKVATASDEYMKQLIEALPKNSKRTRKPSPTISLKLSLRLGLRPRRCTRRLPIKSSPSCTTTKPKQADLGNGAVRTIGSPQIDCPVFLVTAPDTAYENWRK